LKLLQGDCREVMRTLPESSIDAIVTDPPYELGFMGKGWDKSGIANDPAMWAEALRVLKPGGHLLAFSGSRTYHRMVCAIEDAGFEIRDQIMWVYGSGFPKSHNGPWGGTALKPAHEPIVVARKPLQGTVAANVTQWGTGALNIDGCRVEGAYETRDRATDGGKSMFGLGAGGGAFVPTEGRWPANLIHDGSDEVMEAFAAFGEKKTGGPGVTKRNDNSPVYSGPASSADRETVGYADTGTAARFFYCAKASKADRDAGLEGMPKQYAARDNGFSDKLSDTKEPRANTHPTVKPTALMRYLCRLITPPGGTILDPFMGSGSTGRGALLEGFSFVGIEMSPDYIAIAEKRIADAARSVEPADLLDMMEVA
jgi:site-specific DNA-methyltransferase (adenine-specific)